jgi:hypothetical protein
MGLSIIMLKHEVMNGKLLSGLDPGEDDKHADELP